MSARSQIARHLQRRQKKLGTVNPVERVAAAIAP